MSELRGQRVLVIDDDELSRELLELLLTNKGYAVELADSGEAALAAIGEGTCPDAVLMDLQMPGISGAELVRRLREARAGGDVRVIAMSGSVPEGGVPGGADGFLLKPFSMEELGEVLRAEGGVLRDLAASAELEDRSGVVLDEGVLGNFRAMLGEGPLGELYGTCLADAEVQGARMREALAAGDDQELRKFAHALKGSLGMVGARELEGMCLALEKDVVNAPYVKTLEHFPAAIGRLRDMLRALGVSIRSNSQE